MNSGTSEGALAKGEKLLKATRNRKLWRDRITYVRQEKNLSLKKNSMVVGHLF